VQQFTIDNQMRALLSQQRFSPYTFIKCIIDILINGQTLTLTHSSYNNNRYTTTLNINLSDRFDNVTDTRAQ